MTNPWLGFLTSHTQVDISSLLDIPHARIMNELLGPQVQRLLAQPRSEAERESIDDINVGAKLGGDENYVGACNWRGVAVFNATGDSSHLIVRGISSAVGPEYRNQLKRYADHKWTEAAEFTPNLTDWLSSRVSELLYLGFVRVLVLGPMGVVPPHIDIPPSLIGQKGHTAYNMLNSIHISLQEPPGHVYFHDDRRIPFRPGMAMWVNNAREHFAFNMSTKDRYHLIIHGIPKKKFREYILENKASMDCRP